MPYEKPFHIYERVLPPPWAALRVGGIEKEYAASAAFLLENSFGTVAGELWHWIDGTPVGKWRTYCGSRLFPGNIRRVWCPS